MKQEIISFISTLNNEIFKMSRYLYENPEKAMRNINHALISLIISKGTILM